MPIGRSLLDFLIKRCGLRHLHGSKISWALKNVLLEIDLQHLRDTHPCKSFASRIEMYSDVHASLIKQEPIDYLEFGVFQGDSLRYWLNLDNHSRSRFFGFDSFEGLPEQWGPMEKGAFNVDGAVPRIEDERVEFIKGWFNETVPRFAREFSAKNRLVMHLDADLYGSTMLALVHFGPVLRTGTLLFFDEFFAREHEFKALMDWQAIYGRDFRIVAEAGDYAQICAELL